MRKKKATAKTIFAEPIKDESKILIQCPHCEYIAETTKRLVAHWKEYPCERYCTTPIPRQYTHTNFGEPLITTPPNPVQLPFRVSAVPVINNESRIALELRRTEDQVVFIPRDGAAVLGVETLDARTFDRQYTPILDYPTGRCAALFLGSARYFGGTKEAVAELAKMIKVTSHDEACIEGRVKPKKETAPVKKAAEAARKGPKRTQKGSAAQMLRNLIMEGALTDDEIQAKVGEIYGALSKTRVSACRSQLRKDGKDPPKPVKKTVDRGSEIATPVDVDVAPKKAKKKAKKRAKKKTKSTRNTAAVRIVRI